MASVSCTLQGATRALAGLSQGCSVSKQGTHTSCHKSFLGQCSQFSVPQKPIQQGRQHRRETPVAKIREIFMPALSSTMTEGKIVSWLKSEGDKVSKGDSVVVVESDKADMDVETFYDGYLAALVIDEGEVAPVGSPIGLLADTEAEIDEAKEKAKGLAGGSAPATPAPEPEQEAPPPPPPTVDAAAPPPPASEAPAAVPPPPPPAPPAASSSGRIVATPYAKKLAKKYKIELSRVSGTGNYGRITASDVEQAVNGPAAPAAPATHPAPAPAPAPVAGSPAPAAPAKPAPAPPAASPVPGTTVPFTGMQNAVANNMNASLAVPTFRVGYTITTDALDALYKQVSYRSGLIFKEDYFRVVGCIALHLVAPSPKVFSVRRAAKWMCGVIANAKRRGDPRIW
jgi:pyruvate dehydrogenase E2 component (dihydrolipoamide acetyltransferase)